MPASLRILRLTILPLIVFVFIAGAGQANAACQQPLPADKGQAKLTVNVSTPTTYRLWARLYSPEIGKDSVQLRIDEDYCAITVGNSDGLPAKAFSWVDFQNGIPGEKINIMLAGGDHTIVVAGLETGVGVDRLLFTSKTDCVPVDTGDNCDDDAVVAGPFTENKSTPQAAAPKAAPKAGPSVWVVGAIVAGLVVAAGAGMVWWRRPDVIRRLFRRTPPTPPVPPTNSGLPMGME